MLDQKIVQSGPGRKKKVKTLFKKRKTGKKNKINVVCIERRGEEETSDKEEEKNVKIQMDKMMEK